MLFVCILGAGEGGITRNRTLGMDGVCMRIFIPWDSVKGVERVIYSVHYRDDFSGRSEQLDRSQGNANMRFPVVVKAFLVDVSRGCCFLHSLYFNVV